MHIGFSHFNLTCVNMEFTNINVLHSRYVQNCNTSIHSVWRRMWKSTSDRSGSPEESQRKPPPPLHTVHITTAVVLRELPLCHVLAVCIYDTTKSITGCKYPPSPSPTASWGFRPAPVFMGILRDRWAQPEPVLPHRVIVENLRHSLVLSKQHLTIEVAL